MQKILELLSCLENESTGMGKCQNQSKNYVVCHYVCLDSRDHNARAQVPSPRTFDKPVCEVQRSQQGQNALLLTSAT